jgi:exonuclease VII large subunit
LTRTDEVGKLQNMLQQAQEQIKTLSGDLQTAHREAIAARKRTEVEKFKGKLNETETSAKYDNKLSVSRMKDAVKLETEKLRVQNKEKTLSQTQKK